jgi:hypothetical protein
MDVLLLFSIFFLEKQTLLPVDADDMIRESPMWSFYESHMSILATTMYE